MEKDAEDRILKLCEACRASAYLLPVVRRIIDNPEVTDAIPEHIRVVLVEALEEAQAKVAEALAAAA